MVFIGGVFVVAFLYGVLYYFVSIEQDVGGH
jgi:hypothetical protein